jgi:GNAT superfamily N-acetyltransferase
MIIIRAPQTKEDFKEYFHLRFVVLHEPWGQHKGSEKDDYEPLARHYMAVDDVNAELVGVVRWLEKDPGEAWLAHLAVRSDRQRQGIGRMLLDAVEKDARAAGYTKMVANTRLTATDYFEKLGYRITGIPSHFFATLQSVWMEKDL